MHNFSTWSLWGATIILAGCSTVPSGTVSSQPFVDDGSRDPAFWKRKAEVRENDLCVCEIGSFPKSQQGFFKLGCSIWFTHQSCAKTLRIESGKLPELSDLLDESFRQKKVVVGYVGHWASANQTVEWLRTDILPAASKYEIDLRVDNTACSGGNDPTRLREGTQQLLKEMPVPNLEVRVNQEISSGLWDPYLPGKNNFWIEYSQANDSGRLEFPKCREFESKSCWGWIQKGGSGYCVEEKEGREELRLLACNETEREDYVSKAGGRAGDLELKKRKLYQWERISLSQGAFEIQDEKIYRAPELTIGLKNNRYYDEVFGLGEVDSPGGEKLLRLMKEMLLEGLPEEVHVDAGDDSLEPATVSRSIYTVEDVIVKSQKPGFWTSQFRLYLTKRERSGKTARLYWGTYSSRLEAETARDRIISNPLLLKSETERRNRY